MAHGALDGLGMIPAFGAIADGINAAWYAGEGALDIGPNSAAESLMYAGTSAGSMYQELDKVLQLLNMQLKDMTS